MRKTIFIFLLWICSMSTVMPQNNDTMLVLCPRSEMQALLKTVKEKFAPDSRVEIFDIEVLQRKETLVLKGTTTSEEAYKEVISQARDISSQVKDSIRLLPDKKLGDAIWGVVYNSVGTLRAEPRYGSEMVSQALLGTPVKILETRGGWRRIQTPDRYIGWINGSVKGMTLSELQQYREKPKIIVTSLSTHSFAGPDDQYYPVSTNSMAKPDGSPHVVSDLVVGNMLEIKGVKGKFYLMAYPDGREAYIRKTDAVKVTDWQKSIKLTGESVVNTACRFMGVPYLWGGTSSKGLDCSGFTKMVYFMHGIVMARDASQQVLGGILVDSSGDFSDALPGDLVFFGAKATDDNPKERVVHVGIYIGDKRFIHASDYIHIGSFDPADTLFDAYNTNRYLRTKRFIGAQNKEGIEKIFENIFYK